jgi:hypothetical protein
MGLAHLDIGEEMSRDALVKKSLETRYFADESRVVDQDVQLAACNLRRSFRGSLMTCKC